MKNIMEKLTKKENRKKVIIGTAIGVIILAIAIYLIVDYIHDKRILDKSSIDFNSETYKGKKIEVKGNKIIIYEDNGSKTIETINSKEAKMTKATQKIKNSFEIRDIQVSKQVAKTTVKGVLIPKTKDYKTAVVSVKFYRNDVLAATSSKTLKKLSKNDSRTFTMEFVGDYSDCTHTVEVEYVD